jgi:hypothetical protein
MSAPLGEYHAFIDGLVWKRNGYLADAVREERFWCPRPDLLHAHSVLPQHCIEAPLELGVMIAQQDRLLARMVGQKTERLSGTFGGPRLGRLGTHPSDVYSPAGNMDDKEDEDLNHATEGDYPFREEVTRVFLYGSRSSSAA